MIPTNDFRATFVVISLTLLTLTGCQSLSSFKSLDSVKNLSDQIKSADNIKDVKAIAKQAKVSQDLISADLKVVKALYKELNEKVNNRWGSSNSQLPAKKKYVKYSNNYQARSIVDFDKGIVRVETLTTESPLWSLKKQLPPHY